MLENDIEMVENAVARSAPGSKLWDAWNRIKKELSGSGQNSAEKTQPEGETNTPSAKCPCGSDVLPLCKDCAGKLIFPVCK